MLRIVILVVALTAGGACAWLLMLNKPDTQVAVVSQPHLNEVLVASADLSPGQIISEKDLRWQSWPNEAVSSTYYSRLSKPDAVTSLKGWMVRARIVSGEPVMEDKLSRSSAGILASMLPPGKRAVAIRVSAESAAGGFILPNDKVDVIQTMSQAGPKGEAEGFGKTILMNIRVLAIDQKADDAKGSAAVVGKTATLELDAEQAESITIAQTTGTLFLSLRSAAESNEAPTLKRSNGTSIQVYLGENNEKVRVQ